MKKMRVVGVVIGLLALTIPAWAEIPSDLLFTGTSLGSTLPARPLPAARDLGSTFFIDTIPLVSMALPAIAAPVHIELMLEESVVGLDSVRGIGLMISW